MRITEAKANFADLIRRAEAGETFVITRGDQPVARLSKYEARTKRVPGRLKGRMKIHHDFDQLPHDVADAFGA